MGQTWGSTLAGNGSLAKENPEFSWVFVAKFPEISTIGSELMLKGIVPMPDMTLDLPSQPEDGVTAPSPLVQQAVSSLMLSLDDELLRYRQSRSGQAPKGLGSTIKFRQAARKPIKLMAVNQAAAATAPKTGASTLAVAPPPPVSPQMQAILGHQAQPTTQAYIPKTTVHRTQLSHGGTLTTYRAMPEDYLESSEALLGSLPQDEANELDEGSSLTRQLISPLGIGALLLLLVGSASFGYLVTSPQAVSHLTENPLVQRLTGNSDTGDGEAASDMAIADDSPTPGLRGIGPDLSEQEFMALSLDRISALPGRQTSPSPATREVELDDMDTDTPEAAPNTANVAANPDRQAPSSQSTTSVQAEIVRPPAQANLQTGAAAPRASATPTPSRQQPAATTPPARVQAAPPAASAPPPQPLAANPAPSAPRPTTPPAPLSQAPAASPPAPITQAPAAPSTPSTRYYVVTDYAGNQSLESARTVVGDAYVRNFPQGTRIQLGAFSQESSARNLVQQLQNQGISAQVYTP